MLHIALDRLDYKPKAFLPGHVWLAGAGPGDPGCLTLDVASALAEADCVVYDAPVSDGVLRMAWRAELHFAGKRGGRPSVAQDDITALLIDLAHQGKRVLRLKGGDPTIFGRGGEEALALAAAAIPFRFLPGLTASLGALAANGIPTTMRGINKAIILATGHAAGTDEDVDWTALAATRQPLVIYMGLKTLPLIVPALVSGGLPASTPTAIIESATTPQQRTIVGTLGSIVADAQIAGAKAPALVVVGEIVALRDRLFTAP